jgi:hypothetical protein
VVLGKFKLPSVPAARTVTPLSTQPAGRSFSVYEDVSAASGPTPGPAPTGNTSPLAAFFGRLQTVLPAMPPPASSGAGGATTDPGLSPSPSGEAQSMLTASAPATVPTELQAQPGLLADPSYWYMAVPIEVIISHVGETQAMTDQDVLAASGDYLDALSIQLGGV